MKTNTEKNLASLLPKHISTFPLSVKSNKLPQYHHLKKYVLFKTNNQSKIMNNLTISQENQRTHNYVHVLPAKIFKINTDWNLQCCTSIIPLQPHLNEWQGETTPVQWLTWHWRSSRGWDCCCRRHSGASWWWPCARTSLGWQVARGVRAHLQCTVPGLNNSRCQDFATQKQLSKSMYM